MIAIDKARIVSGVGGAGLIFGAFLPWVEASAAFGISKSVAGTDGSNDGWFTLGAGVLIVILAAVRVSTMRGWPTIILGLIAGGIGIYDFVDIRDRIDAAERAAASIDASVGFGMWLTLIAAAAAIVGGVLALQAENETTEPAADDSGYTG